MPTAAARTARAKACYVTSLRRRVSAPRSRIFGLDRAVFAGLIALMALGSYMAVLEVQYGEEADSSTFDKIAFLYVYLEPTASGAAVLTVFIRRRRLFLESFRRLHAIAKKLEEGEERRVSTTTVRARVVFFATTFIVSNSLWNIASYFNGKTALHSVYEYLGWGISFHLQQVLLLYYTVHLDLDCSISDALNDHLSSLDAAPDPAEKLSTIAHLHSEMCGSLSYINRITSPTLLLFSVRTYLVACCTLMSLNGMLPKLKVDFVVLALVYLVTCVQIALRSEAMRKKVRSGELRR